ncbi:hypothetical protein OGAPHI_005827 [Ogataea philodendri]|uniref:Uncharacterized protein n=1 Tax=Ogataea philodendri TaxID=1378263 RepID=A0A9P8NZY1_9ASCO|nr:uncharacterized protein OGAPHI_005827 [Ogataea philodendri]KAH3662575.1 hypothetical protein OGAPHI_005827 [Ogataea philodendri]
MPLHFKWASYESLVAVMIVKKSKHVGINGSSLSPKLDGPQSVAEYHLLRHQLENLVGDSCTVQCTQVSIVDISKQVVVFQGQIGRDLRDVQSTTDQVDVHSVKNRLDDRHKRIGDGLDLVKLRPTSQQLFENREKVLSGDMFGDNNKSVDIGAWPVHSQSIRAKRKDLTTSVFGHAFAHVLAS